MVGKEISVSCKRSDDWSFLNDLLFDGVDSLNGAVAGKNGLVTVLSLLSLDFRTGGVLASPGEVLLSDESLSDTVVKGVGNISSIAVVVLFVTRDDILSGELEGLRTVLLDTHSVFNCRDDCHHMS